jgi:hypothetical protein
MPPRPAKASTRKRPATVAPACTAPECSLNPRAVKTGRTRPAR